jgi:hypothetical protein
MIRDVVDGDKLLILSGDDAGEVFLQFIVLFSPDQVLPARVQRKQYGCKSVCRCWP